MDQTPTTIEGTWEEIQKQASRLVGRRVRLEVLPEKKNSSPRIKRFKAIDKKTEKFLKDFAGSWVGDDLDECLDLVYKTRTPLRG